MEKKISADTERVMTQAIEKAAMLVNGKDDSENINRDEILAKCLMDANVDSKFAKLASAAFNRRSTVLRFQKTADEHKADTFPLTDGETVLRYMGGNSSMDKAASEKPVAVASFSMTVVAEAPAMKKTASENTVTHIRYEDRVPYDIFERHLESMLQKQAAAHSQLIGDLHMLGGSIAEQKEQVAEALSKVGSFEFSTMCNIYGDKLEKVVGDKLTDKEFNKTAAAVNPNTPLSRKIARLINDVEKYEVLNDAIADYQEGLGEFSKTAAEIADSMHKSASILGDLIRTPAAIGLGGLNTAEAMRRAYTDQAIAGFGDAVAMGRAGTDIGVSPSKILDANFLSRDRHMDRLLGWSDMAADPAFSMYPSEQVFLATQKAMDTDKTLERPDRRELLRAQVGQLLAQNNRQDMAQLSALAATLKAMQGAGQGGAEAARAAVKDMASVEAPAAPEVKALSNLFKQPVTGKSVVDLVTWADTRNREEEKEDKEEQEKEDKKTEEKNKAIAAEAKDRKAEAKAAIEEKRKLIEFWLKQHPGYSIDITSTGPKFVSSGRAAIDMESALAAYKNMLS